MKNAKKEFINAITNITIKCAVIEFNKFCSDDETTPILLPINYTPEEYDEFIKQLDFDYDAGYGTQELFGNIWANDNSWWDRGEYDGSEWWQHQVIPNIPKELLK